MIKYIYTIIALFVGSTTMFSSMEIWIDYKIFSVPNDQSYVETYLNFTGTTLTYNEVDSATVQANAEILYYFKQGEEIISFKKIQLDGPILPLNYPLIDFLDVQRFSLDDGEYELIIEITDKNNPKDNVKYTEVFDISRPEKTPFISDICFLKGYSKATTETDLTKSGYDLLPFVSNYFPSEFNSLIMYAEVYNTEMHFGAGEKYALYYYIENFITGDVAGDNRIIKRQEAQEVTPIIQTFDITDLPKGDYRMVVEVRNKKNEIISSQKQKFYRNKYAELPTELELASVDVTTTFTNRYKDSEIMMEHLNSLTPIASTVERTTIDNVMPEADLTTRQQYLYYFWARRYNETAEEEWEKYRKNVALVQEKYGTRIKKGYETDRGRVYLMYGSPNSIAKRHNNSSMAPYEIWHYYEIANFNDKRFLFYDPTKIGADFTLLTSDVPTEITNRNWYEVMIQTASFGGQGEIGGLSSINNDGSGSAIDTEGNGEGEILKDLYFHTR